MTNHTDAFEYDVALSFATEDRAAAEELGSLLAEKGLDVFYDEYRAGDFWGEDLVDHLVNLYARKARYCLVLVSRSYPLKRWTEAERLAAQQRAFRDAEEYILPVQLDDAEVPGLPKVKGYHDLRQSSIADLVNALEQKLGQSKGQAGPPPESHDLRSGNIPSNRG